MHGIIDAMPEESIPSSRPAPPAGAGAFPRASTVQVTAARGPWPLHDASATRVLEQAALAQAPEPPLMARAGLALAQLGRALAPHARHTWVFAGPGNNGGDGLVAARLLHNARHPVHVRLAADPSRLPSDAAHALRMAASAGVEIKPFDAIEVLQADPQDLAIDALLGIGSRSAPQGAVAAAIEAWQKLQCVRLAVDIPSGLHPDTGALLGTKAAAADATLALLTLKPGCFTAQGRDHAGQVWWHDLGLAVPGATAWLSGPPAPRLQAHAAHKGSFGDVWLVGGSSGMAGALVLAAHAALAAGAGRVHACPLGMADACRASPEIMLRPVAQALAAGVLDEAVAVAGCGGGQAIVPWLPQLLEQAARLVLDADGLNAVAADPALQQALAARAGLGMATVMTPHPLEAARLLACTPLQVQADRLGMALRLARRFEATVVLKGSGTVIAGPDGRICINPTGNAALASAGTGDVLAGWLGGLWTSQGCDAFEAACDTVWRHGDAADRWRAGGHEGPLRAGLLVDVMSGPRSPGPI